MEGSAESVSSGPDGNALPVADPILALAAIPQSAYDARFHAVITDLISTSTELVTPDGTLARQARTTLWGTPLPTPPGQVDYPLRFPGQYADRRARRRPAESWGGTAQSATCTLHYRRITATALQIRDSCGALPQTSSIGVRSCPED
ncbi:hypothetical protein HUT19_33855 [Streptomyces sp. NA02950]|uniref:hypothetical protein n=1 Tax=Streptomyces sp. NA02950 TaxID=2742137 RepID=UPI0015904E25|nr:hypothetical protein [Streptomyces sp. NA02950]QKV96098.1 hypothetical protein HUT19_33855 [Streptomyces sp. NA02950]